MLTKVVLLSTLVIGLSLQEDDPPVWESYTGCNIPNELTQGICTTPSKCPAFQEISNASELGSTGRLSFIRALQCDSGNETMICCVQNGRYKSPQLAIDVPLRVRNDSLDLTTRFGESNLECGVQAFNSKIQGVITEIDEFPWAALLFYRNNFHGCGGVLISSTFVLTAAHCLTGPSYDRFGPLNFIRLREYNLLSDPDCVVINDEMDCTESKIDIRPRTIQPHPNYVADSLQQHHDIGLVEIERAVPYSDFLRPICLPEPGMRTGLASGRVLSVCGWGRTDFFNSAMDGKSPVKMKASLPFVDSKFCNEAYRSQQLSLGPGQVCAGGRKDRDSCAGDSGSPLMFFDWKQGVWVVSGVVSRGASNCGQANRPGIYTNVREYLPWIKQMARI